MSGHTPGVWLSGNNLVYALNDNGVNRFFASIQPGWVAKGPQNRTKDQELQANARLIAAAPELLAVCESYSLPLGGVYKRDCFEFGQMEVDRELARRAAIAKATGEAA